MKWGLPARLPFRAKLKQAIPACPAVLFYLVTDFSMCRYAHFLYIFFPSFRILTAAFTSRSIQFPHSHMYVRSDKASSFFLFPHTLSYLTGCKITVYFYKIFPTFFQLISKHRKELPISVILYPFSKVQISGYPFQVQIFHTYRIILLRKVMTELMMEIFPLVLYPFIT